MPNTVEFSHLAGFDGAGEFVMRGGAGGDSAETPARQAAGDSDRNGQ